jgi:hypothetical protein
MQLWRNAFLVKTTLLFFTFMLLCNPVYAQQDIPLATGAASISVALPTDQNRLPVIYLSEEEAQQFTWQLESKGYAVREGTLAQLEQMTTESELQDEQEGQEERQEGQQKNASKKKQADCETEKSEEQAGQPTFAESENHNDVVADENLQVEKKTTKEDCEPAQPIPAGTTTTENEQQGAQMENTIPPADFPDEDFPDEDFPVEAEPVPPADYPPPPPPADVHAHVGVQANVSYSGGGNNSDLAKVFFIFAGVVVVAAFVVYAGKYIADIVSGKETRLWREVVFRSTFLSTKAGRHGEFYGARLATGFVSNELIQLALVGELGKTDLDLVLNEYTEPTPLNFSASYWMLGASARLHLTDAMVNASYLFLDFMGGSTSRSATDLIGAARFGVSFGLDDHWRLGASMGAQYIGLDEDQGFRNDGSNYWTTLGVELGARF